MTRSGNGRYDRRIVDVCEALHAGVTGSGDPVPDDERTRMVDWLRMRLDDWHVAHANWKHYDDAIHTLIRATLAELYAEDFYRARQTGE